MNLFIVESPNKCVKIKSFLGAGYTVMASVGHIREIPAVGMNIDIENGFEPKMAVIAKKKDIVTKMKVEASKAETIYLATDPDREGAAISYSIYSILPPKDQKKCLRVSFHEITKKAIQTSLDDARPIQDFMPLIQAQKARQVLDRLIGYEASGTVIRGVGKGTSAGRVQSPALRIICNRQREIDAFVPEDYWFVDADLKCKQGPFQARVETKGKDNRYTDHSIVDFDLKQLRTASYVLSKVERKEKRTGPYPPFDTVGITIACSNIFGWSASKTMSVAQEAFSQGAISYHRTDSYAMPKEAVDETRALISSQYPSSLPTKPNFYSKKSSAATQEAHSCIYPVHVMDLCTSLESDAKKLYDLVRARFISCQMSDMIVDTVHYTISAPSGHTLSAHGQTIKDQGWFVAYPYSKVKDEILPYACEGEKLILLGIADSLHVTQPPAKFNDGSLIKRLEDDAIGRPSTRASILKALETKEYVTKEGKAFVPTSLGKRVCEFLEPRFDDFFMDLKFTAGLEEDLDLIADGKKRYIEVVKPVYDFLMKKVADARASTPKREKVLAGGKCPSCKTGDVVEKESRYGKFFSCGNWPKCKVILLKQEDGSFVEKGKGGGSASTAEKSGMKCSKCGKDMLIRTNRKKGTKFLGCAGYPGCKNVEKIEGEK